MSSVAQTVASIFGVGKTSEWDTNRRVRTKADAIKAAQTLYLMGHTEVLAKNPSAAASYLALSGSAPTLYGGSSYTAASIMAAVVDKLASAKGAQSLARNIQTEMQGATSPEAAPAALPPMTTTSLLPAPQLSLPAPVSADVTPFYKQPWFAPAAVLGTVTIVGLILIARSQK